MGALNGDIIQQFLIESVVITFFGGLLAIVFSFLIAYIVNSLHIENVSMYIS
ncbi:MAG: hypothetical protein LBO09_09040 [Candidatus Peribacteria bacterium]|nr:hypothetical protein [Candidatus Peribacteria bacterium]